MTKISPQRALLEGQLLPAFASRFAPNALVVNIGAGDHPYREHFACRFVTADPQPGCDECWPAEAIPHPDETFDGVVFVSVFDRLDDPMQAMREIQRVLKPGGFLLFGAADIGFAWRVERERWPLTPGGVRHVLNGLAVIEWHAVDRVFHYAVAQKPTS